jgi:hypothetical protein
VVNIDFLSYLVDLDAGAQAGLDSLAHRFGVFRLRAARGHPRSVSEVAERVRIEKDYNNGDGDVIKERNSELVRFPYHLCVEILKKAPA